MILIKDRHYGSFSFRRPKIKGKYDTYKGSTHNCFFIYFPSFYIGKYDTYKGSTPTLSTSPGILLNTSGNMILIKD